MLWVGVAFLALLAIDVWHHPRRHQTRRKVFMVVEGGIALACFSYAIGKMVFGWGLVYP